MVVALLSPPRSARLTRKRGPVTASERCRPRNNGRGDSDVVAGGPAGGREVRGEGATTFGRFWPEGDGAALPPGHSTPACREDAGSGDKGHIMKM